MGDRWRGHPIRQINAATWIYADTGERVTDRPDRPCGHCGLEDTPEGHDGCLGALPGVVNACCGHGVESEAYVQMRDGSRVSGDEALRVARDLRASAVIS